MGQSEQKVAHSLRYVVKPETAIWRVIRRPSHSVSLHLIQNINTHLTAVTSYNVINLEGFLQAWTLLYFSSSYYTTGTYRSVCTCVNKSYIWVLCTLLSNAPHTHPSFTFLWFPMLLVRFDATTLPWVPYSSSTQLFYHRTVQGCT